MKKKVNLEGYLADITPKIQTLIEELRKIVLEAVPNLVKVISWCNLSYQTRKKCYVCAISPRKLHVNINFWRRKEL